MKCLLAAESMILRRIFHNAVDTFDFTEVVEATDGKHALSLCDEGTTMIITSRELPLLDGLELTRQVRGTQETSGVRVLMIAERRSREDLLKAAEAGVNGYMVKPLSLPAMRSKIERLLQAEVTPVAEGIPAEKIPAEAAPAEEMPTEAAPVDDTPDEQAEAA